MEDYLLPVDVGLPMRAAGQWAKAKLDYLARHIDVFETSMCQCWTLRNYVDLQAGTGKNRMRTSGEVVLGSPLLALTTTYDQPAGLRHPVLGRVVAAVRFAAAPGRVNRRPRHIGAEIHRNTTPRAVIY